MTPTPHKWAKEIHAWADGQRVQSRSLVGMLKGRVWRDNPAPDWENPKLEFRVRPAPVRVVQYSPVFTDRVSAFHSPTVRASLRALNDGGRLASRKNLLGVLETTLEDGEVVALAYYTKAQVAQMLKEKK